MSAENKWQCRIGWTLTVLASLPFVPSSLMKFLQNPQALEGFTHLGWDASMCLALGVVELTCVLLYLLPKTSVLGAILLTGYLGGAIATHVRVHEHPYLQCVLGILVWGGLFLRDSRIRDLIPLRTKNASKIPL